LIAEGTYQFLGFFDAFSIVLWAFILLYLINSTYQKNITSPHYKYYKRGFYFKFFAALIFATIYIYKYGGGDSTAYWDTAQKFSNLLLIKPFNFFEEMTTLAPMSSRYYSFDVSTGVPPVWIYNEYEGLFASKVFALLSLITFRSYFAMTMICSYISFKASWKLYEMAIKYNAGTERNLAIGALFLPSTAFWCTGISKDTIVYCCIIYALFYLFKFINKNEQKGFKIFAFLFIIYFLLANIRSFMIITAIGPFFVAVGIRWSNRQNNSFSKISIQLFMLLLIVLAMSSFFSSEKAQEITQEAQVIQSDLKNNREYGGLKYNLGITDFSPTGMLKAMPISIYTSFYRPYLWEAGSLFILISALETFVFLLLSISLIFRSGIILAFSKIRENEFLIMAITFSLILGFFAGFTSGLFGVLVRFKAPLLPFLFIVLTMNIKNNKPLSIENEK
jgi:hypothetical protein